jgi:DNA adenine methylase
MKYMGSKNRIAKHILPIILKDRKPEQWYVEPFVGGANMIDKVTGNRMGGELNHYVAELLIKLQEGWEPPLSITEEEFLHMKQNKEYYPAHLVGYVGTQLSFGFVWFCAYRKDNGGERRYSEEAHRNVLKQAPKLKGVVFKNCSYLDLEIPPNSIIYCDPPYAGTDKYRGFEQIDHDIFWEWCRERSRQGHSVFISEFAAPGDFTCLWQMQINTAIAERAGGKNVIEKLFTYDPWINS